MSDECYLLKNTINAKVVKDLSVSIKKNDKNFDHITFCKIINEKLKDLELKERISLITKTLNAYLPNDVEKAIGILLDSLPSERPNHSEGIKSQGNYTLDGLNGFIMVAITNYVAEFGIDHYKVSMKALYQMTSRFSAEEAARFFIEKYPTKTLALYKKWTQDKNMHVRRLVSESTRPRLPWAMQLASFRKDPSPILPLLELLKNDKELYVRRSVANNLNDISKDHPKIILTLLKKWNRDKSPNMKWMIKHALRSLLKNGNTEALALLGFHEQCMITVKALSLTDKKIQMGDHLNFSIELKSTSKDDQWLMIDYVIHHMKANGSLKPKVFKLKKVKIKPGQNIIFKKEHPIKEISTRKYYLGKHEIQLMINGNLYPKVEFELV